MTAKKYEQIPELVVMRLMIEEGHTRTQSIDVYVRNEKRSWFVQRYNWSQWIMYDYYYWPICFQWIYILV